MSIRLIATDLDGTLLNSRGEVSPRARSALDRARAAGMEVVPVTARQPRSLASISGQAGFSRYALCGNGAHGLRLDTGETLFEERVPVQAQSALARALLERLPDVRFASVRDRGQTFVAHAGYARLARFEDHKREPAGMGSCPLDEVLALPSNKFIIRHPRLGVRALLAEVHALKLDGFAVTHSGSPFLEVLAEGVSKASGMARLCGLLGIAQGEVLAFGDAANDAELLAWAGRGVAMGNAEPEALSAADEVTLSNDQDGVAAVVERLLERA